MGINEHLSTLGRFPNSSVPYVLVQTRKYFPIYHKLWVFSKIYLSVNALGESLGYWCWSLYSKVLSNPPPILSSSIKIKYQTIMSPVNLVHIGVKTIVFSILQVPFHDKDGPVKYMLSIGQGAQDISYLTVNG